MAQYVQNCRLFITGLSVALITTIALGPASAQLFDSAVAQLPVKERVALQEGQS